MRRATRFQQLATSRNLHIHETFCHHFRRAAHEVAQLDGNPSLASVFVSRTSFDRWMTGEIKGFPRPATCRVLEHLLGEAVEKLFGPPDPSAPGAVLDSSAPATTTSGAANAEPRTNTSPHFSAMESFRLADRQLGGGHVYRAVLHYLRQVVAPGLFGAEPGPGVGEDAFRAAAVLTEMAAWMAHDAGRDDLARGHFSSALRLGQDLADVSVGANVLAGMSHLELQSGRADEAVVLARRGLKRISACAPVPVLASRLHAMEARALAQLGEPVRAQRALDDAREAQVLAGVSGTPDWVAPFDEAALASEAASVLVDVGVLEAAAQEAARALALRDASRARSRAFSQAALAQILLAQGRTDEACTVAHELLAASPSVGSLRLSQQLAALQQGLAPHHRVRVVSDLLDRMAVVAKHRKLLLGSLSLPEGPQA